MCRHVWLLCSSLQVQRLSIVAKSHTSVYSLLGGSRGQQNVAIAQNSRPSSTLIGNLYIFELSAG